MTPDPAFEKAMTAFFVGACLVVAASTVLIGAIALTVVQ